MTRAYGVNPGLLFGQNDSLLRKTNAIAVGYAGTMNGYQYDGASRLSVVSDGTNSATYSYLANSPLLSHIVFKQNTTTRMTTSKQYDYANRLRIGNLAANGCQRYKCVLKELQHPTPFLP